MDDSPILNKNFMTNFFDMLFRSSPLFPSRQSSRYGKII